MTVASKLVGFIVGLLVGTIVDVIYLEFSAASGIDITAVSIPLIFVFIGTFHEELSDILPATNK